MSNKQLNIDAIPFQPEFTQPSPTTMSHPPITSQNNNYYYYYYYSYQYYAATQIDQNAVVFKSELHKLSSFTTYHKIYSPSTQSFPPNCFRSVNQTRARRSNHFHRSGNKSGTGDAAANSNSTHVDDDHNIKTTLMIKNIPNYFRRDMLIKLLDKLSQKHHAEYDFLYLPMDFQSGNNLGYGFVNFTDGAAAARISEVLKGYDWCCNKTKLSRFLTYKVCQVAYARIQGKEALIQNFERSRFRCRNNEWLPVTFTPPRGNSSSISVQKIIGKCMSTSA